MAQRCAESGLSVDWIRGVDGQTLARRDLDTKVSPLCAAITCTPAMIGCALSHYACWQRVVDEELHSVLILEDDAVLVPDFQQGLAQALEDVPLRLARNITIDSDSGKVKGFTT